MSSNNFILTSLFILNINFLISNYLLSSIEDDPSLYEIRSIDISTAADSYFSSSVRVDKYENLSKVTLGNCSGKILVYNSTLERFYINSTNNLNLMMGSKVNIIQSKDDDITLKAGDKIFVAGDDNKITVAKNITINGELSFDENAELTFEFDENYEDQVILFDTASALQLKKGCRLIFQGKGTIRFADGQQISLLGTQESDKPFLVLNSSSSLELENNATANIVGIGKIMLDKGALINIGSTQHLIIGESTSNDIDIKVDRSSVINVDSSRDSYNIATLSIQKTVCSIDFEQGGMLAIGNYGIVEINALDNVEQKGWLKSFKFDNNGILSVETNGILRFGRNVYDSLGVEKTIDWDNFGAQIIGDGIIEYLPQSEFKGKIQSLNSEADQSLNTEELVGLLIQSSSSVDYTIVFIAKNENKRVRTKNGVIVPLFEGDVISGDNYAGYIYGRLKNRSFIISPDGVRT